MPFPYYERLSAKDKEVYRQGDAVGAVRLPRDSYHTEGFFKRESSLFHQLVAAPPRE